MAWPDDHIAWACQITIEDVELRTLARFQDYPFLWDNPDPGCQRIARTLAEGGRTRAFELARDLRAVPGYFPDLRAFKRWLLTVAYREALRSAFYHPDIAGLLNDPAIGALDAQVLRYGYIDQFDATQLTQALGLLRPQAAEDRGVAAYDALCDLLRRQGWGRQTETLPRVPELPKRPLRSNDSNPYYPRRDAWAEHTNMSELATQNAVPRDTRDRITSLVIDDGLTKGRPAIKAEEQEWADGLLHRLLLGGAALRGHIDLLAELYRGRFRYFASRSDRRRGEPALPAGPDPAFRHRDLLSEPQALAIGEQGLAALQNEQLFPEGVAVETARLLLNPYALWDMADLIDILLPDYWLDVMERHGTDLAEEFGIDLSQSRPLASLLEEELTPSQRGKLEAALAERRKEPHLTPKEIGSGMWQIEFVTDVGRQMRRRIAARAFGDADREFELILHRVPGGGPEFAAEMEMKPAPTANDVSLPVTFPRGHVRTFVLAVPESMKRRNKPRDETRSNPCELLPTEAFAFRESEWQPDGEWIRLVFRSVFPALYWHPHWAA